MSLILSHARSGTAKTMFVFLLAVSALTATYLQLTLFHSVAEGATDVPAGQFVRKSLVGDIVGLVPGQSFTLGTNHGNVDSLVKSLCRSN